jgi:hypothetical protein
VLRYVGSGVAVVADLAKLSLGREDYYLREIAGNCQEYLSGPGPWICPDVVGPTALAVS